MTSSDVWDTETARRYDDPSSPMVEQLRRKASTTEMPVAIGDMASTQVGGTYSLVYLAYNTLGNLRTQEDQVHCFRNAARYLAPGGHVVIEMWVPGIRHFPALPGQRPLPWCDLRRAPRTARRHRGLVPRAGRAHRAPDLR